MLVPMTPTILTIAALGALIAILVIRLLTDEDCGDFGEND